MIFAAGLKHSTYAGLAVLAMAGPAFAREAPARFEILTGWRDADGIQRAGLKITLEPGWKTYWRSPGDGGIAPEFDLTASGNLTSFTPEFPAPMLFDSAGMQTPGYKNEVILPLDLVPLNPDGPITLQGTLSMGVCNEICLPVTVDLSAELSPTAKPDPAIEAARAARPRTLSDKPTCRFEPLSDGMRVTANLPAGFSDAAVPLLEFADPDVWISPPQMQVTGGTRSVVADLVPPSGAPFAIDRSALRFTVIDGARAVEMTGCSPG